MPPLRLRGVAAGRGRQVARPPRRQVKGIPMIISAERASRPTIGTRTGTIFHREAIIIITTTSTTTITARTTTTCPKITTYLRTQEASGRPINRGRHRRPASKPKKTSRATSSRMVANLLISLCPAASPWRTKLWSRRSNPSPVIMRGRRRIARLEGGWGEGRPPPPPRCPLSRNLRIWSP